MRAMVVTNPRPAEQEPLEPVEVPIPEPGPGEVLVRV